MFATHHAPYHLPRLSGVGPIFWTHAIRGISESLAAVFVPIYLHQLGYSLTAIFGYLALAGLIWSGLVYPVFRLMNRFGSARLMAVSLLFSAANFGLLLTLSHFHWSLALIAAAWALQTSLYWPAMRATFAKNLAHRRTGRTVSAWSAITTVATSLAPAIGGLIAMTAGPRSIYGVAIFGFLAAALPISLENNQVKHSSFDFSAIRQQWRTWRRDIAANFSDTVNDGIQGNAWPLFIFFLFPTYAAVGALSSVMALSSIAVALYVGRHEEKRGPKRYIKEGTSLIALGGFFRLFAVTGLHVTGINVLTGFGYSLYLTAYNTQYYERIEAEGLPYLFAMQLISAVAWAVLFGTLCLLSLVLTPSVTLLTAFALAIPASFGIRLIR